MSQLSLGNYLADSERFLADNSGLLIAVERYPKNWRDLAPYSKLAAFQAYDTLNS